jgi:hypothetical protein
VSRPLSPTGSPLVTWGEVAEQNANVRPDVKIRINGWLTSEEAAELEKIRMSQFFLVLNDGSSGERLPCRRHGDDPLSEPVFHTYLTYMCVERPFRGLRDAFYAWARVQTDDGVSRTLGRELPNFATSHPETARALRPVMAGEEIYAVALGRVEPITETRARHLATIINGRRPPTEFRL